MVTKKSHILKQTWSFQLQICLSMCVLFVTTRHWRVKGILSWTLSLWNNIYFAFAIFRDSLFARNQSLIWFSFWFAISKRILILLLEQNRFVSSAKSRGSMSLANFLRSFTKITKLKGPSIEPWRTLDLTIFISVLKSSYKINCFLFNK